MTTPHTPPAALLDVAAIEARAAAATCPRCSGRGTVYDSTPAGYIVERQCVACLGAGRPSSDVLALLAALRILAAQHAADVAAAVATERERAEAAEKALATLRTAVGDAAKAMARGSQEALVRVMHATPAESGERLARAATYDYAETLMRAALAGCP